MCSKKLVILGVVMSLAGLGWGADASFDSDPMGIDVFYVEPYVYQGGLTEWITGTASEHWLVNFSEQSAWLYGIYIGLNQDKMEEDEYAPVDTDEYGKGSFLLGAASASGNVSDAFIAFLAYDANHSDTYDAGDTAEHIVVGYLY